MRFLEKDDVVAFSAPASGCPKEALDDVEIYFRQKGFRVKKGSCVYQNHRFLSGNDAERAAELNTFFNDDSIGAIFAARGGYGSLRLADILDYAAIKAHPKLFVGLSDTTAVQNAILAKTDVISLTGCVLYRKNAPAFHDTATERSLWKALRGEEQFFVHLKKMRAGKATGRLIGGCLSVFATLLGTPYMPDPTNAILVFEETGEQPYAVDRLLTHCALAGVFDKAAAVVFGDFTNCISKDPADGTIDDVLDEWKNKLNVPCVSGLPYGHGDISCVLPLGATATLDADKGILTISEIKNG